VSSLGYVLTVLLLGVVINGLQKEIEHTHVKCVDATKLGGIITVFKDSVRFRGDLNELEKSFMLLFGRIKEDSVL